MVAVERARLPLNLPLLVTTLILAAALGTLLVLLVGDSYLRIVGQADYVRISLGVLLLLGILSVVFAGAVGFGAFLLASAIGLIPPRFGTRRVHLMGVLMVPLMV